MPKLKEPAPSAINTEMLARRIEAILVKDHVELLQNKPGDLWGSFVRGAMFGLGSVVGATVMVALVLFILQQLGALPWIGRYFEGLGDTIRQ